jgi:branched-chain amino acid transport system permease protein
VPDAVTINLLLVQLLNGVQLGLLLFLVAAGLTLVFGVMNFINLAHGVQYMLGAYLAASFGAWAGSFWIGLVLAMPVALLVGLALELLVFRHLYERDHLSQVLATFGVILTLQEAVRAIWGSAALNVPQPDGLAGGVPIMPGLLYRCIGWSLSVWDWASRHCCGCWWSGPGSG